MRRQVRNLVEQLAQAVDLPGPVYEIGSFQVPGQESIADLRSLFPGRRYVGVDMRAGRGVDVVADIEAARFDEQAGTILCLDTLEHVRRPERACRQMARLLAPHGLALCVTVMRFPIHEYPEDYWRVTPAGLRQWLEVFPWAVTWGAGDANHPHTVVGLAGGNGGMPSLRACEIISAWSRDSRPGPRSRLVHAWRELTGR
ncbi:MAG: class I SAM-dependent methyltransferase [Sphaerochaeta sp.]|nr:class I SAM-dependent methyltransferase [Sphaerochaeta sp.]